MNREFLDFVEDILDAMEKAEILVVKQDIPEIKPQIQQILTDYSA
jgi:hypothetical protein